MGYGFASCRRLHAETLEGQFGNIWSAVIARAVQIQLKAGKFNTIM